MEEQAPRTILEKIVGAVLIILLVLILPLLINILIIVAIADIVSHARHLRFSLAEFLKAMLVLNIALALAIASNSEVLRFAGILLLVIWCAVVFASLHKRIELNRKAAKDPGQ